MWKEIFFLVAVASMSDAQNSTTVTATTNTTIAVTGTTNATVSVTGSTNATVDVPGTTNVTVAVTDLTNATVVPIATTNATVVPTAITNATVVPTAINNATAVATKTAIAPTATMSKQITAPTVTVVPTPKPLSRPCGSSIPHPPTDDYWNVTMINSYIDKLKKYFDGDKIEIIDVPSSNGQKIVKIRPYYKKNIKNAKIVTNRPAFWVEAGFEGNHATSTAVALHFIDQKLCTCTSHCLYDYYVLPLANPQGHEYADTTDSAWVKTRENVGNSTCQGTNLLHNFANAKWSSGNSSACSNAYRGTAEMSAAETKYQLIKQPLKANIKMSFTITEENMILSYGTAYNTATTTDTNKAYLTEFQKATTGYTVGQYAQNHTLAYGHPLDFNEVIYGHSFNFAPKSKRNKADLKSAADSFVAGMNAAITYAKTDQKFEF